MPSIADSSTYASPHGNGSFEEALQLVAQAHEKEINEIRATIAMLRESPTIHGCENTSEEPVPGERDTVSEPSEIPGIASLNEDAPETSPSQHITTSPPRFVPLHQAVEIVSTEDLQHTGTKEFSLVGSSSELYQDLVNDLVATSALAPIQSGCSKADDPYVGIPSSLKSPKSQTPSCHADSGGDFKVHPAWKTESMDPVSLRQSAQRQGNMFARRFSVDNENKFTAGLHVLMGRKFSIARSSNLDRSPSPKATDVGAKAYQTCWCFPLQPDSYSRLSWDILAMLFVFYDAINVPLQALTPAKLWLAGKMAWTTRVFWTLDIPMSFLTGIFCDNGEVDLKLGNVAKLYCSSWFLFDLAIVAFSWVEILIRDSEVEGDISAVRLGRVARILRLLRIARLARLLKVPRVIRIVSFSFAEGAILVLDVIKAVVCIAVISHCSACVWFALAWQGGEYKQRASGVWLNTGEYSHAPFRFQYLAALQWSCAHFMQGEPYVKAHSESEMIFSIITVLLGFLVSAVFVGSVATSMTSLKIVGSAQAVQFSKLRRYLRRHSINTKLAVLVNRNVQQAVGLKRRNILESDIELLKLVSEPLRVELHYEIHGRVLSAHPFLHCNLFTFGTVMRKVCHQAVRIILASREEIIFTQGHSDAHPCMRFVVQGRLRYTVQLSAIELDDTEQLIAPADLFSGQWVCEMALWAHRWSHRGTLRSIVEECTILTLMAPLFQGIMKEYFESTADDMLQTFLILYAQAYVNHLNNVSPEKLTDLDTLTNSDLGLACKMCKEVDATYNDSSSLVYHSE